MLTQFGGGKGRWDVRSVRNPLDLSRRNAIIKPMEMHAMQAF